MDDFSRTVPIPFLRRQYFIILISINFCFEINRLGSNPNRNFEQQACYPLCLTYTRTHRAVFAVHCHNKSITVTDLQTVANEIKLLNRPADIMNSFLPN